MPVLIAQRTRKRELLAERKTALVEKARRAGEYLRSLGAHQAYLFGPITRDDFHPHSVADMAVSGLPHEHIYAVEARIADILGTDGFDLVYLEHARERLRNRILEQGIRLCQPSFRMSGSSFRKSEKRLSG